jgi:hypothetical protein
LPTNGSSTDRNQHSESKEKPRFIINAADHKEESDLCGLRSDVEELSQEVQTAVGDLKKSIADIRSTVSEMENPFNVLRTLDEKDDKLPPGTKSLLLGTPEEDATSDKELYQQEPEVEPEPKEPAPKKPAIPQSSITLPPTIAPSKPIKASAYLDWIWGLLDEGLTAENIHQLANLCEMTNYLPKQTSEFIYTLAVTAENIRLIGFTKSHLLLFMYKAASLSKTEIDPEDMKTLIDLTEQQLKKQTAE